MENKILALQALAARPESLFDEHAVLAALEEVVDVCREKNDERLKRFNIILRQCRPFVNGRRLLKDILMKLVATKEESEVAKVITKSWKSYHTLPPSRAPARPRGTSFRQRRRGGASSSRPARSDLTCWIC